MVKQMKSNLLAIIGCAVGFAVGCLASFKLRDHHKHTGGSFRELYNENRVEGGVDDL